MKNFAKVSVSLILCLVLTFSCVTTAFAGDLWHTYWQTNSADINKGIYVAPGQTESERTIRWYTDKAAGNYVDLSLEKDMNNAVEYLATVTETPQGDFTAEVYIDDLELGKTYYYTCNSGEYKSSVYTIKTVKGNDFSAMYVTDVHVSYDSEIADNIEKQSGKFASVISHANEKADISVILSTGDQATTGRRDEYCGFVASTGAKNTTVAILEGNHDRKNIDYKYFNANPETDECGVRSYIGGDYWFVKGDTLFLVMDANNADGAYHRRFIKNAVKENENVKWRVAMFHHDLLGGRVPKRESENKLLRTIWLPLMDEFAVDLVLMGHSHYYTISDVVYRKKSVLSTADINNVTDAKGSIYMVSGSVNYPKGVGDDEEVPVGDKIGQYDDTGNIIYNILDFSENSIVIKSYYDGEDKPFNTFTISKTTQQGGHPKYIQNPLNAIVRALGEVYAVFNNLGVKSDLKEKYGVEIPFFSALFGSKD